MKKCEICDIEKNDNRYSYKYKINLCRKHFNQLNKFGRIADETKPNINKIKNEYVFTDDETIFMKLNNSDDVVIIDKEDYDKVKDHKWHVDSVGYARTHIENKTVRLHRFVLEVYDSNTLIDHINRNKLDNRKKNLRITTKVTNSINRDAPSNNKTGTMGVEKIKIKKKYKNKIYEYDYWIARLSLKDNKMYKYFKREEDAISQRIKWEEECFKKEKKYD